MWPARWSEHGGTRQGLDAPERHRVDRRAHCRQQGGCQEHGPKHVGRQRREGAAPRVPHGLALAAAGQQGDAVLARPDCGQREEAAHNHGIHHACMQGGARSRPAEALDGGSEGGGVVGGGGRRGGRRGAATGSTGRPTADPGVLLRPHRSLLCDRASLLHGEARLRHRPVRCARLRPGYGRMGCTVQGALPAVDGGPLAQVLLNWSSRPRGTAARGRARLSTALEAQSPILTLQPIACRITASGWCTQQQPCCSADRRRRPAPVAVGQHLVPLPLRALLVAQQAQPLLGAAPLPCGQWWGGGRQGSRL